MVTDTTVNVLNSVAYTRFDVIILPIVEDYPVGWLLSWDRVFFVSLAAPSTCEFASPGEGAT